VDANGWINLAGIQLVLKKPTEIWTSLRKAVEIGGEPVRSRLRQDKRFDSIRNTKEFLQIVPPLRPKTGNMGLAPLPGL